MRTGYLTAQICKNGHVLTYTLQEPYESRSTYCTICGQETVSECPECNTAIRGAYFSDEFHEDWISGDQQRYRNILSPERTPSYCHNCGKPYPWAERALEVVRDLIDETENYSEADKDKLKQSLPDLIADSPKTEVAVARLKKWLPKAGQTVAEAFKKVMVDLAAEVVKKQIGL